MASSTFSRSLLVKSTPEMAWSILTDVPRVASWVRIVEDVTEISQLERYRATLKDQVGPFKLRADLDITCPEVQTGSLVRIAASGEDRQIGSRISVDATLQLQPSDDGHTTISVEGRYEVAGRVATLGSGTINKKANRIVEDFFSAAAEAMGAV